MGAFRYLLGLGTAAALTFLPIKNAYAQNILSLGNEGKHSFLEHSIKTGKLDSFLKAQHYNKNQESYKSGFLDFNLLSINPIAGYTVNEKSGQNTNEKITSYLRGIKLTPENIIIEASKRQEINKTNQSESHYEVERSSGPNYDLSTSVDTEADINVKTTSSIGSVFTGYTFPLSKFISIGPIANYTKIETGVNGSSFVESIIKTTGAIQGIPYDVTSSTKTTTPIKSSSKSCQKAIGLTSNLGPCIINIWRSYNKNKWENDLKWNAYLAFKLGGISNIVDIENLGAKDSKLEYTLLVPIGHNSANPEKLAEFQKNKDKINKSVSLNTNQKESEMGHLEKNHNHNLEHHLKIFLAMNKSNGQLKPSLGLGYIGESWNIETILNDDYQKIDLGIRNMGISATRPDNKQDKISWNAYLLFPFK